MQLTPAPYDRVVFEGGFWGPRVETNRSITLDIEYAHLRDTGRLRALRRQWKPGQPGRPHEFWDSDIAKWLEAAAYVLGTQEDRKLKKRVDDVVDLYAAGQESDGYLNTHFSVVEPDKRWTNLRDKHELYTAGHLIEAAVAYHRTTGKRKLLDVMCRLADHIDSVFGRSRGKKRGIPGHEEIELALIQLYRATGRKRYLRLAKYFIDERGRSPHYWDAEARARGEDPANHHFGGYAYYQAHKPVREQSEPVGHAVRAMYLYCGMADVGMETDDAELLAACRRIWDATTRRQMYVTGGIGALHRGESFGEPWELPNESAYAETCAAIGLAFFAHRMLQVDPNGRYADVMERALYNGALSGVSLDGKRFFYVNPLASDGRHHREEWFGCACCPPNIARMLASLGRYAYSTSPGAAWVHLYAAGGAALQVDERDVGLAIATDYPWDGHVRIEIDPQEKSAFALCLRIPDWCAKHRLKVNGKVVRARTTRGYVRLKRTWRAGDVIDLHLEMPVVRVAAHPSVAADVGRVAFQRGPIVYCLEDCDHRVDVRSLVLPDDEELTPRFDKGLLGGCTVLHGHALAPAREGWNQRLYRPANEVRYRRVPIRAVPYHLWDNRSGGAMTVFIPRT
jgi:uncharacterized protein